MYLYIDMIVSILMMNMIAELVTGTPTLQDLFIGTTSRNEISKDIALISREEWKARPPKDRSSLESPVRYVVVHHSFIPPVCEDQRECAYAMKTMQSMHMDDKKWSDIAYNFAVGGDGVVYEGRGWTTLGAHSLYFNKDSIGICLIGNYNDTLPSKKVIETTKTLIEEGVRLGHLTAGYKVIGHRQVRPTECPGEKLYEDLKTWPHFDPEDHKPNFYRRQAAKESLPLSVPFF